MHMHVGTNLWPETIMHARCKLFFKARGVRPAGKGRWPWVVGTSDLRTDAPSSRPPHAAWPRPAPARPSYTRTIFKTDQHLARSTTPRRSRGGIPAASYPRPEIRSWGRPPSKFKKSLIRMKVHVNFAGIKKSIRCKRPKGARL